MSGHVDCVIFLKLGKKFTAILMMIMCTQQTQDIESMLGQCWPDVYDSGPTLTLHCFNVSFLLGIRFCQLFFTVSAYVSVLLCVIIHCIFCAQVIIFDMSIMYTKTDLAYLI